MKTETPSIHAQTRAHTHSMCVSAYGHTNVGKCCGCVWMASKLDSEAK